MTTNSRGTCLAWSPLFTNALIVNSWLKGWRQSLNVPSTYQFLALTSCWSCWLVANTKCRLLRIQTSAFRKSAGMFSSEISNARSVGSSGLSCCLSLFAALAMFSGFGTEGQGFSSIRSSSSTSLTMAGAGRNKLSRASCNSKIV